MKNLTFTLLILFSFMTDCMERKRPHEDKKKEMVSSDLLIQEICQSDAKNIDNLFKNKKVALKNRTDFFREAALTVFCTNNKFSFKHKASLFELLMKKNQKFKLKVTRINPLNKEMQQLNKARIMISHAIIQHLLSLVKQLETTDLSSRSPGLASIDKPMAVPHDLYLGYACAEAELSQKKEVFDFLKSHDLKKNREAYENWHKKRLGGACNFALSAP